MKKTLSILDKCEEHFVKLNKIISNRNISDPAVYYAMLCDVRDEWNKAYKTSILFAYRWLFYIGDTHNGLGNTHMNIFDGLLDLLAKDYIDDLEIIIRSGLIERYASWSSLIYLMNPSDNRYFNKCNYFIIGHLKNYLIRYMIRNDKDEELTTLGLDLPSYDSDDEDEIEYAEYISKAIDINKEEYMHLIDMLNRNAEYHKWYSFEYDNAAALIASNLYLDVDKLLTKSQRLGYTLNNFNRRNLK